MASFSVVPVKLPLRKRTEQKGQSDESIGVLRRNPPAEKGRREREKNEDDRGNEVHELPVDFHSNPSCGSGSFEMVT